MTRDNVILWIGAALGSYLIYDYLTGNPNDTTSSAFIDAVGGLNNLFGTTMKTSQAGKDAITQREGYELNVYADAGGKLTAGVGHLLTPIDGVFSVGDAVTQDQIATWFGKDIAHAEHTVSYYTTSDFTQNQFDALVSATFNLGSALFRNGDGTSTRFSRYLDAGDYQSAATALLQFNHVAGVVNTDLTVRRSAEAQQFIA